MRQRFSLICTFVFLSLALLVLFRITDLPKFSRAHKGSFRLTALALRDNVSSFEKNGSAFFSLPYLEKFYDRAVYLQMSDASDCRLQFTDTLRQALLRSDSVDIFLLSHGNYDVYWLDAIDPLLRKKIRMVYNTGCGNSSQCGLWKERGVRCYISHSGAKSISPVFYAYFLRRLAAGNDLHRAVDESNARAGRFLRMLGISDEGIRGSMAILYEYER